MDIDSLTHIIVDPLGPNMRIVVPTPAQLREIEEAISESLIALDFERPWQPVDDLPVVRFG